MTQNPVGAPEGEFRRTIKFRVPVHVRLPPRLVPILAVSRHGNSSKAGQTRKSWELGRDSLISDDGLRDGRDPPSGLEVHEG